MKDYDFLCWALHHLQQAELMKGEMCHQELSGPDHYIPIKKQLFTAPSEQKKSHLGVLLSGPLMPKAAAGPALCCPSCWIRSRAVWQGTSCLMELQVSTKLLWQNPGSQCQAQWITQFKTQLFKSQLKERYFWPGCQGFIKSFSVNQSNFPLTSLFIFPPPHTVSAWLILSQGQYKRKVRVIC